MFQLKPLVDAGAFLENWPVLKAARTTHSQSLPVCRWLPRLEALAAPGTRALVQEFVATAPVLEWRQTYSAADFGATFIERYGWTELVGLRGPIPSETIACGFLMLGPEIEYSAHAHSAEELYLPLAGTAAWMRGEENFVVRAPGRAIIHPSWMPHAMRTERDPLLVLYVWRGGSLAARSKIIRPA
jgi:hypothetical protein